MGLLLYGARWMLTATRLVGLALLLSACSDLPCGTRSVREIGWDDAPSDVGFSAEDFTLAFAQRWRAEVINSSVPQGYPPSLESMDQEWVWAWRPNRARPVEHRRLKQGPTHNCNIIRWEGRASTLRVPAYFEGSTIDGMWAYAGRGHLVTWALPTADIFPVYWSSGSLRRTSETIQLTRSPHEFEEEASVLLGVQQLPAVQLGAAFTMDAFQFTLIAIDDFRGNESRYPLHGIVGGSPILTLAEPLP